MSWVDPKAWESLSAQALDFDDIDLIATPLYEAASQKLEELETKLKEGEWITERYEKELRLRRKQALGSLALHLLQLSVIKRLQQAKRYFDKTSPKKKALAKVCCAN
jgi:hypothetical protein